MIEDGSRRSVRSILITGAAAGLGRGFLDTYRRQYPQAKINALDVRVPDDTLETSDANTHWHAVDLTDASAVSAFGTLLEQQETRLDLVVHCAGVRGLEVESLGREMKTQHDVQASETLEIARKDTMLKTFEINCIGTFLLMRVLQPSLLRVVPNTVDSGKPDASVERPRVVIMGSRMGSIGHNTSLGGGYAYRASKAALNATVRALSFDIPSVIWTVMHPGRVESKLVPIREDGAMTAEESVADCVSLIERLDQQHSGRFLDRFGADIPW